MKTPRFDRLLKQHGYKETKHCKYQGTCIYEKEHMYNKMVCTVKKDNHGKSQEILFTIHKGTKKPKSESEIRESLCDQNYLIKECTTIKSILNK